MPQRRFILLGLCLLILVVLSVFFFRELAWVSRFLVFGQKAHLNSSKAIPTCLGCPVRVVFVEGDSRLVRDYKSETPSLNRFLQKSYWFTRAYTNSLDPAVSRYSLLNLRYPDVAGGPQAGESRLETLLKEHGYSLELRTWSIREPGDLERHVQTLEPNALVILMALTGSSQHEQIRGAKDAAIHIPLLIYHPEAKDPGRIDDLISLVDVGPMLLNLIGLPAPDIAQGRSLMAPEPGRPVYGVAPGLEYAYDGEWKLIRRSNEDLHIFYLPLDPDQQDDLSGLFNPWVQKAVLRLTRDMDRWHPKGAP
jgi:hypothetical protein